LYPSIENGQFFILAATNAVLAGDAPSVVRSTMKPLVNATIHNATADEIEVGDDASVIIVVGGGGGKASDDNNNSTVAIATSFFFSSSMGSSLPEAAALRRRTSALPPIAKGGIIDLMTMATDENDDNDHLILLA
jgi:hypothetical protein